MVSQISYKTLIGTKSLRIRFDEVDRFIRLYVGTKYLVLFGSEKYEAIYHRIWYLIGQKSNITYVTCHNYARIKIGLYDSLALENWLTLHA